MCHVYKIQGQYNMYVYYSTGWMTSLFVFKNSLHTLVLEYVTCEILLLTGSIAPVVSTGEPVHSIQGM